MKSLIKTSNYEKYYKDLVPYFKKEKNQKYFTLILTVSASIFFFLFAINPTLSTIAKLKKQIVDAKFVEQKLSEKINNLSSLSQEYEAIKEDLPFILDAVPNSPQAPILVGQIQSLAQQSSITITDINISPVNLSSKDTLKSSLFTFEITGKSNYENSKKFLSDLINMQRAVSLDSIQISKSISADEVELVLKGKAYYKKQ